MKLSSPEAILDTIESAVFGNAQKNDHQMLERESSLIDDLSTTENTESSP